MSVKIKKIKDNQYIVWCDEQDIGTITTYHNEFHNKYLYLKFNLAKYPTYFPFNEIKQIEDQSLQVMTDSTNTDLIHLLLQNGFKCKRHCYTPEVTNKDLKIQLNSNYSIHPFNTNSKNYSALCHLLYQYYQEVHQAVSPLTVSEDAFTQEVPKFSLKQTTQIGLQLSYLIALMSIKKIVLIPTFTIRLLIKLDYFN